jgi:filamentous hemagglutinin
MLNKLNFSEKDRLKLPLDKIIIEVRKLRDYLLNPAHPEGATKAQYLSEMGYNQENYHILEVDLRNQHLTCDVQPGQVSIYGEKFEIVAPLVGPNGKKRTIRSVWMIRKSDTFARLITLIPEKKL